MRTKAEKQKSTKNGNSPFFKPGAGFIAPQAKLNVGQPGDKYELEADRVAEKVVNGISQENQLFFSPAMPLAGSNIQEKPLAETITPIVQKQEEEEEEMQAKFEGTTVQMQVQDEEEEEPEVQMQPEEEEEEMLQPKKEVTSGTNTVETALKVSAGGGSKMDPTVKAQMEQSFGTDFSNVNIHAGSDAVQLSEQLGAQAFTKGSDIYFNEGKYQPETTHGKLLLAHELTHTIQQGAGVIQHAVQREVTTTTAPANVHTVEGSSCDEATQREKEAFVRHGIYGPQSLTPGNVRVGGFEASYDPGTEILQINVRGKTRFVNGLNIAVNGIVNSYGTNLSSLARLLNYIGDNALSNNIVSNYYTWNEAQKRTARTNFRARIAEAIGIWQDAPSLAFKVDAPCWDDVRAHVSINIDVQDEGTAVYSGPNNPNNDHLQVSLVKIPEQAEYSTVRNLLRTTADRVGGRRMESIDTSTGLTMGASVNPNRFGGRRNDNPYDTGMTLTNQSLQNTPSEINNFGALLRRSVSFRRNESTLDEGDKREIDRFIQDFTESDNNPSNSMVTLVGHASRLGSTSANRRLVAARLNSVMNYLREKGFPNIDSRVSMVNRSDTVAERYDDTENNAAFFRMVEIIVGTGERQNTVAHEFGHVFNLLDEYATEGTSFTGTGTRPGTEVGHTGMSNAIGAGRVLSENSDNIMSAGNEVRGQHYGPFGVALEHITHKNWRLV